MVVSTRNRSDKSDAAVREQSFIDPLRRANNRRVRIPNRIAIDSKPRQKAQVAKAAEGLRAIHRMGFVHADLNPKNVLVKGKEVRLIDYGQSCKVGTSKKRVQGTIDYISPEQATGGEITPRSDLYSLGAMLYEMVTGRPPFMGDDEIAIIGQHINTPPVAPSWHNPSLPQTLDSLIMRLLAKDPAERPESAAEVLQALEAIDPADAAAVHEEEQGSLDSMSRGVFVGRHREMDQLKATFEDTLGGHGKMVALVGEPGIGKTRTAEELATYARMRGGQVLWGRCYEGGGAPPYWPWVQAIRSYVTDRDAETVRREMGSTASVIAEVVPDVKERLPDLQPPLQIDDPESARFRLFDSITTFLKTASGTQPIVLILEDLHWADKPSLMLLEFVARELSNSRLMIVGNYRDMELNRRHPLSVTLGELTREHLFDRVVLRGLQKHDVHRFIEVAAGIEPPSALVDVVYAQTEGNPLFVTETVRLLIQEGDLASGAKTRGGTSSWEIRIPEGVREVIGRRLDRLSERCNEVLTIASVVGRQFHFNVLMKLAEDVSENMLLDVLDEALNARVVEEVATDVGLYQFTHALMQETLMGELSAARRVRLHARIAEALESSYGDEADEHAAELAGHFTEAEPVLGGEKAVEYSIIAGERALDANGYDDAEPYFRQARALREGQPEDEHTARILHGLGRILSVRASLETRQEGWDLLAAAFDIYVETGNVGAAAQAAKFPAQFAYLHGTVDLTSKGLALLDPNSLEAGYLHARQGIAFKDELGDFDREIEAYDRAMKIAKQYGDRRLEGRVTIHYGQHYESTGEPEKVIEYCLKADELARETDDPLTEHRAVRFAVRAHSSQWDMASARPLLKRAAEIGERLRRPVFLSQANETAWEFALWAGDWVSANSLAKAELERAGNEELFLRRKIVFQAYTGSELSEQEWASAIADYSPRGQVAVATTVWLAARESYAIERIEESLSSLRSLIYARDQLLRDMARSARALATGDDDSVPGLYDDLSRFAGWWDRPSGTAVDHLLGMLAARMGRYDQAAEHFEYVIMRSREVEFRPTLALVSGDYAQMLVEHGETGDPSTSSGQRREKATELQDEALAIAQELGMQPLLERVLAQREILKA
ncbi:MAG: AAA family ATPase [Chloroflexi bacterium]|nr:AAA family ATPase [Chloroflexota bacterium]